MKSAKSIQIEALDERCFAPFGQMLGTPFPHDPNATAYGHPGSDFWHVPDLTRLRAFKLKPGQGVCMRAGCWHASFVLGGQVTCMMLTRRSTTQELVAHLVHGSTAAETSIVELAGLDEAAWKLTT